MMSATTTTLAGRLAAELLKIDDEHERDLAIAAVLNILAEASGDVAGLHCQCAASNIRFDIADHRERFSLDERAEQERLRRARRSA